MKQAHIFVSGFVQGVGFRQFIKSRAKRLNITGWVKNLPDGRVETIFQGDKNSVEKIIKECDKGPFLSEVESVVVDWEEKKEVYKDFKIL